MRSILYILFILFLEITCGVILGFLYWMLASFFYKNDFGRSRINEGIYYIVILLPPVIYCWMEHLRFKRERLKNASAIYLAAGIVYLVGGLIFLLIWTDFYLLGN